MNIYKCEKCKRKIKRLTTEVIYIDCPYCEGKAMHMDEYKRKVAAYHKEIAERLMEE